MNSPTPKWDPIGFVPQPFQRLGEGDTCLQQGEGGLGGVRGVSGV